MNIVNNTVKSPITNYTKKDSKKNDGPDNTGVISEFKEQEKSKKEVLINSINQNNIKRKYPFNDSLGCETHKKEKVIQTKFDKKAYKIFFIHFLINFKSILKSINEEFIRERGLTDDNLLSEYSDLIDFVEKREKDGAQDEYKRYAGVQQDNLNVFKNALYIAGEVFSETELSPIYNDVFGTNNIEKDMFMILLGMVDPKNNKAVKHLVGDEDYKQLCIRQKVSEIMGDKNMMPIDWFKLYNAIPTKVQKLPENIMEILKSTCPFSEDKQVKDTHILLYIPKDVSRIGLSGSDDSEQKELTLHEYVHGLTDDANTVYNSECHYMFPSYTQDFGYCELNDPFAYRLTEHRSDDSEDSDYDENGYSENSYYDAYGYSKEESKWHRRNEEGWFLVYDGPLTEDGVLTESRNKSLIDQKEFLDDINNKVELLVKENNLKVSENEKTNKLYSTSTPLTTVLNVKSTYNKSGDLKLKYCYAVTEDTWKRCNRRVMVGRIGSSAPHTYQFEKHTATYDSTTGIMIQRTLCNTKTVSESEDDYK